MNFGPSGAGAFFFEQHENKLQQPSSFFLGACLSSVQHEHRPEKQLQQPSSFFWGCLALSSEQQEHDMLRAWSNTAQQGN
jgi:hypothetical protein